MDQIDEVVVIRVVDEHFVEVVDKDLLGLVGKAGREHPCSTTDPGQDWSVRIAPVITQSVTGDPHASTEMRGGGPDDLRIGFRAMASDVNIWIVEPGPLAATKLDEARGVFERVESACTRFDPDSPLMQANRAGRHWHAVPRELVDAVAATVEAYRVTDGLFDPRVLDVLHAYGYGTSLAFESGPVHVSADVALRDSTRELTRKSPRKWKRAWKPGVDRHRSAIRIGRNPIDLGGIGKGLAVRWAAKALHGAGRAVLVEAGGDCYAQGRGIDDQGWAIAVENPFGGTDPIAVLKLSDRAVATSSTRLRKWTVGDREVHHLIDPRTQRAADSELVAVTVVDADPAAAEVWSKALFVAGRAALRASADSHGLAALWVDADGRVATSKAMKRHVVWEITDVR